MRITKSIKPSEVRQDWYVADANGKTLGRFASELARRLRGKHKPEFTPHVDTGDYIVVVNAEKIKVTGNKLEDKLYYRHSGYTGKLKTIPFKIMLNKKPVEIIERAVKGMLPRGPLGRMMLKKLKVYAGEKHPHASQQPQSLVVH